MWSWQSKACFNIDFSLDRWLLTKNMFFSSRKVRVSIRKCSICNFAPELLCLKAMHLKWGSQVGHSLHFSFLVHWTSRIWGKQVLSYNSTVANGVKTYFLSAMGNKIKLLCLWWVRRHSSKFQGYISTIFPKIQETSWYFLPREGFAPCWTYMAMLILKNPPVKGALYCVRASKFTKRSTLRLSMFKRHQQVHVCFLSHWFWKILVWQWVWFAEETVSYYLYSMLLWDKCLIELKDGKQLITRLTNSNPWDNPAKLQNGKTWESTLKFYSRWVFLKRSFATVILSL